MFTRTVVPVLFVCCWCSVCLSGIHHWDAILADRPGRDFPSWPDLGSTCQMVVGHLPMTDLIPSFPADADLGWFGSLRIVFYGIGPAFWPCRSFRLIPGARLFQLTATMITIDGAIWSRTSEKNTWLAPKWNEGSVWSISLLFSSAVHHRGSYMLFGNRIEPQQRIHGGLCSSNLLTLFLDLNVNSGFVWLAICVTNAESNGTRIYYISPNLQI